MVRTRYGRIDSAERIRSRGAAANCRIRFRQRVTARARILDDADGMAAAADACDRVVTVRIGLNCGRSVHVLRRRYDRSGARNGNRRIRFVRLACILRAYAVDIGPLMTGPGRWLEVQILRGRRLTARAHDERERCAAEGHDPSRRDERLRGGVCSLVETAVLN